MTHLPKRFLRVKNINKDVVIEDENDLANRNYEENIINECDCSQLSRSKRLFQ